jgi:hypothetical protein
LRGKVEGLLGGEGDEGRGVGYKGDEDEVRKS